MENLRAERSNKRSEMRIDKSESIKDNKKGFRIVIENLDTGERVVDSRTRAVIGAFAEGVDDKGVAVRGIIVSSCKTPVLVATIEGASKSVEAAKEQVIENSLFGGDIGKLLKALLKEE